MHIVLILGNQLFPLELLKKNIESNSEPIFFMREDHELCTHFKYHKHKIVFFLSAMREYADELKKAGYKVHYEKLGENKKTFDESLANFVSKNKATSLSYFEIEDKFFEKRIEDFVSKNGMSANVWQSPMFLTSRKEFKAYLEDKKKPFMKSFYEQQRKRLKILVDSKLQPVGGKWSFDEDNRKPLPKNYVAPKLPFHEKNEIQREVAIAVNREFTHHPGSTENYWLPTSRDEALHWLDTFLNERFYDFGPYEDALSKKSPFLSHSVLTPFLNTGLLTPQEVVKEALKVAIIKRIPINSVEGFIRQIIGWREFIRGIYQNYSEQQESTNFWNHTRQLKESWYNGTTGIEPLDDVIKKVTKYGYAHHIERLMIAGSLMLLLEVSPQQAHKWFMEMFIDSSDWVMGPNVYGMALFSDGGIFATKPYICGSNYYKKMGGYKSGDWQDGVDGLYWSFIEKHKEFFLQNPRMSMMVRSIEKMDSHKKETLYQAAHQLREKVTTKSP